MVVQASPLGQREELSEDDEERVESPPLDGASLPSALVSPPPRAISPCRASKVLTPITVFRIDS
jgi:hypothetical protein